MPRLSYLVYHGCWWPATQVVKASSSAISLPYFSRNIPGRLFTKRIDVLPHDLVKSENREIGCYNNHITLKFDSHLGSVAADVPVKFQSDRKSLNPNLPPSGLHEILR